MGRKAAGRGFRRVAGGCGGPVAGWRDGGRLNFVLRAVISRKPGGGFCFCVSGGCYRRHRCLTVDQGSQVPFPLPFLTGS